MGLLLLAGLPLFCVPLAGISPRRATGAERALIGHRAFTDPATKMVAVLLWGRIHSTSVRQIIGMPLIRVRGRMNSTPREQPRWPLITCISCPLWCADWRVRQAEKGLRMSEPAGRVCADPA